MADGDTQPPARALRAALTPEVLDMVRTIALTGSFAAAARSLGLAPSTLTYRVRQLETALDVLLFDRRSGQAVMTAAGRTLCEEAQRLLGAIDGLASRVRRVASGWEPQLTIVLDGVIHRRAFFELCEAFHALEPPAGPPTQLRVREEILSGTWLALRRGEADLVLGAVEIPSDMLGPDLAVQLLGEQRFVYCVAPQHPLARLKRPASDADLVLHRGIVVADSGVPGERLSLGLVDGQATLVVSNLHDKLEAIAQGLGGGYLPEWLVAPALAQGRLVALTLTRRERLVRLCATWRHAPTPSMGRALQWWLQCLQAPRTRAALIGASLTPEPVGPAQAPLATLAPLHTEQPPHRPAGQRRRR